MEVQILRDLIQIPSYLDEVVNETKIAQYIEAYIKKYCIVGKIIRQKVQKGRYNLLVFGCGYPKLLFLCHIDTVKPSGIVSEAIIPKVRGDRVYGLGSIDMKGGIAALLSTIKGKKLDNIALFFDCGEEYDFCGVKKILNSYKFNPSLVICPEPTDLRIINGCRGVIEAEFDVIGKSVHAAVEQNGVNAIEQAVNIVSLLRKDLNSLKYKSLYKTSVNIGGIRGGKNVDGNIIDQPNAVADIARVVLDIRPAHTLINSKNIYKLLTKYSNINSFEIQNYQIDLDYKGYRSAQSDCAIIKQAIKRAGLTVRFQDDVSRVGFYEASFIASAWGCPAVSFGPGPSSIAHMKDEYVTISSLQKTRDVFKKLLG